jgi:hypothetical protein
VRGSLKRLPPSVEVTKTISSFTVGGDWLNSRQKT